MLLRSLGISLPGAQEGNVAEAEAALLPPRGHWSADPRKGEENYLQGYHLGLEQAAVLRSIVHTCPHPLPGFPARVSQPIDLLMSNLGVGGHFLPHQEAPLSRLSFC